MQKFKNYKEGNIYFTENKKEGLRYALVCLRENDPMPATVSWKTNVPKKGSVMKWLQTGEKVSWSMDDLNWSFGT